MRSCNDLTLGIVLYDITYALFGKSIGISGSEPA
jgi:hypothetical protein